ncbi:hypothetical protein [Chondrinema litorale]|uniref:hypothetical protein n=1 Tax=Chondrinema litorale TaxID=2994555 RepID=UPI002543D1D8|nr:hypothetical protein [Chondrinema litorale]UZR98512.1 hypothetical protein OQ292_31390 [Chondrinema litorale]
MPANPKYLTKSKTQRFSKISAAILGGFLVAASFHLSIAAWLGHKQSLFMTYSFTLFILWTVLMFVAFLAHNGWKIWIWYGGITIIFSLLIYLGTVYNPSV